MGGDGIGVDSFEKQMADGTEVTEAECLRLVTELEPTANGMTIETKAANGNTGICYAEFNMTGRHPNPRWNSCYIERQ